MRRSHQSKLEPGVCLMWEFAIMRPYLVSLAAGILVGIVYSLLNVRSPAPPVIALVGLLGILAGEQVVPLAKRLLGVEQALSSLPAGETAKSTKPEDRV